MARNIRKIRVEGNIAFVQLTRGMEAVIDAEDIDIVNIRNWRIENFNNMYAVAKIDKKRVYMHRLILSAMSGFVVDHIDGDTLNNRRSNLRIASTTENARNCKVQRNNTSGVKGVCWNKARGAWAARIKVSGKNIHLGYFSDLNDAAASYAKGSAMYHGEFGRVK